jgi:hypothetical protein
MRVEDLAEVREPQRASLDLNLDRGAHAVARLRTAGSRRTGTVTSPKEIAPVRIDRGMARFYPPSPAFSRPTANADTDTVGSRSCAKW